MGYDSWCDRHLYIYSDASQIQSSPVSNYALEHDSLFAVNILNVVWFMWGFPNECICFDLGLRLSGLVHEEVSFLHIFPPFVFLHS